MTRHRPLLSLLLLLALASPAPASVVETSAGRVQIAPVVTGLAEPWALAFLPDGSFLVTERAGRLLLVQDGTARPVEGVPKVAARGQGGLLDLLVPFDFPETREIWLSFAQPGKGGAATATGFGRLSDDGTRLDNFQTVFAGTPMPGSRHFGARLVEMPDGSILLTTGDRGTGPDGQQAQDPARAEGKLIRLNRDGTPAETRPGHLPGVMTLGHRNVQGATLDRQGRLYAVEHGAKGGDELNRILPGRNYGWPVISYGVNYNGDPIGTGTTAPDMEQPLHYWDPSIAPSGLIVHSGRMFPEWRGDFLTGSLNSDYIARLAPDRPARTGFAEERIRAPETARVRDLAEAPDGAVWFLSVTDGAVYRMARGE